MPEPRSSLLLAAHQCHPLITAFTEALPDIWIAVHPTDLLRLLEGAAGRSADAVSEGFIVPECRVLEHEPTARLADPAPPLAFVAVTAYPAWSVEVAIEAEFLL